MQVDFIGTEAVEQFIISSKKKKFTIIRGGGQQALPLFDCLETETNEDALNEFKRIASVLNKGVTYKIILFDEMELTNGEDGQVRIKKKGSRAGKIEALFALSPNIGYSNDQDSKNTVVDYAEIKKSIVSELLAAQREDALLNELKALRTKVEALEGLEEEEEEEESAEISGNNLQQIMGLVSMLKAAGSNATINGDAETSSTKIDNINAALKILNKYDKHLDTDLLKLAEIAEKNTSQFNMLLSMLRSM